MHVLIILASSNLCYKNFKKTKLISYQVYFLIMRNYDNIIFQNWEK